MKLNKLFVLSIAALILTGCNKNKDNTSSGSTSGEESGESTSSTDTTSEEPFDPGDEYITQGKFLIGQTDSEEARTLSLNFKFADENDKRARIVWGDGTSTDYTESDLVEGVVKANKVYTMPTGATEETKFDFSIVGMVDEIESGEEGSGFQYIESFDFGDSVKTIPTDAFLHADRLTSVIGDRVEVLGGRAFSGASALASASFPNVEIIGIYAFYETALTNFIVSRTVTQINGGAFSESSLESVTFLNRGEEDEGYYIQQNAFKNCEFLTTVNLADGLEGIGSQAFYDTAITKLDVPASCTVVNAHAFGNMAEGAKVEVHWADYARPTGWDGQCTQGESRTSELVFSILDKYYPTESVTAGVDSADRESWVGPYAFVIDASQHKGEEMKFRYEGPIYTDVEEARLVSHDGTISLTMTSSPKEIKINIGTGESDEDCVFYFLFNCTTAEDFAVTVTYTA